MTHLHIINGHKKPLPDPVKLDISKKEYVELIVKHAKFSSHNAVCMLTMAMDLMGEAGKLSRDFKMALHEIREMLHAEAWDMAYGLLKLDKDFTWSFDHNEYTYTAAYKEKEEDESKD